MNLKRKIIIQTAIYILILLLATSACSLVETAQAFTKAGDDFMVALKDGNYGAAYDGFVPQLQEKMGTVEDLRKMIEDNQAQPKEWTFSSWSTSKDADQNDTAKLEGNVTYQDGRQGGVTLELIQVEGVWKIFSFNLTW